MCASAHAVSVVTGAVSDMWCGKLAADDDTAISIEIFTDGSSLIPKAWPRVAASGGWGVLVSAICDNQRIAVIGMFFEEVTVDSGHPFFLWCEQCSDWCVRNSSNFGGLGLVSRCQPGGQECHDQTRQYVCHLSSGQESPLHFTRAIGTSYEALSGKCKKQVESNTPRHIKGSGKMNSRIPCEDGQLFLSLGKQDALVDGTLVPKISDTSTDNPRDCFESDECPFLVTGGASTRPSKRCEEAPLACKSQQ